MRTWFTADTHFGHAGVIEFSKRPFASVHDMDRQMIDLWNAVVQKNDEVFHLGDFMHKSEGYKARGYFDALNGKKHLVGGNHDFDAVLALPWASPPAQLREVAVDGQRITLCHYAMRDWPDRHRGAVSLYGHQHGRLAGTSTSCDVGVDAWDYMPVSLEQIRMRLAEIPSGYVPEKSLARVHELSEELRHADKGSPRAEVTVYPDSLPAEVIEQLRELAAEYPEAVLDLTGGLAADAGPTLP